MPNYAQAKEHPEDVGCLTLYRQITFSQPASLENGVASAFGIHVGKLPAGSFIHGTDVHIATAFNAGTTNVFTVGNSTTADAYATTAEVIAGTPGTKRNLSGSANLGYVPLETQVYAKYSQTGTAATAGVAHVTMRFTPIAFHLVDTSF